jgi:hypothetical protein
MGYYGINIPKSIVLRLFKNVVPRFIGALRNFGREQLPKKPKIEAKIKIKQPL